MKRTLTWTAVLTAAVGLLAASCAQASPTPESTAPPTPTEILVTGSVSEGGRLYDKWWEVAEVDEPAGNQPLWATQDTNTREGTDTWRCKECHGWDYLGAGGAYGSGSHFTGFPGVFQARVMSDGELLALLDGSANHDHDFSAMGSERLASLVTFLQEGQVDSTAFIDYQAKGPVEADADHGQALFASLCTECHGEDGRAINFHDPAEPEYVGNIAVDNPWEFVHKVRVGQPGTPMPSAIDGGWSMQDVLDVLAFAQTLPTEPASVGSASRGGRLYDNWWNEAGLDEPTQDNPIWARQDTNTRSGADTWRCKECHGWDYKGAEGAYGSGSHFTGFPGVFGAQEKSLDDLVVQLTGGVDPEHDFAAMSEETIVHLVTFLKEGLVDVSPLIDSETKEAIGGDSDHGEELYTSTCAACHGEDGRTINFHDADEPEFVGTIALDNPWEFIHKVRAGQPGTAMPAAIEAGWSLQDIVDLLAFAQTLPTGAP